MIVRRTIQNDSIVAGELIYFYVLLEVRSTITMLLNIFSIAVEEFYTFVVVEVSVRNVPKMWTFYSTKYKLIG